MTDVATSEDPKLPKKGKKGLIIGILGALILGGAAFFVTFSGSLDVPSENARGASLGKFASSRHLRFQAYLEVESAKADEVKHLSPRILDVLNTYLRAIAERELEDPASMNRLRAQMLRRVQVVVGEENVRDLLITEFVLN
jgi:flagellar FliL protein